MKEKNGGNRRVAGRGVFRTYVFGERWYGFDDGMYAAARPAEILSTHGDSLDATIADFPATVNTPKLLFLSLKRTSSP